jgi:hypothetical protein
MKTEPTEALANQAIQKIMDSLIFEINYEEDNYDAGYSAALHNHGEALYIMGFSEGQSNPKIKQLEWERNGTIWHVNQYNPIGYRAAITKWAFGEKQYSVRLGLNDSNNSTKFFNSIDEAKDFVQKDFERRVKECLIF